MNEGTNKDDTIEAFQRRYMGALHAMQSGVLWSMDMDPTETSPKHLRVGINSAFTANAALVRLLVAKGVITELEYWKVQAEEMEREQQAYTKKVADLLEAKNGIRPNITLA